MNFKLFIANIVIVAIVLGVLWFRSQLQKRSETRRANGQLRLLGPTDELSELTQVVRQWADTTGVLRDKPDVLPDFGSNAGADDSADSAAEASDDDADDSDASNSKDEEETDKHKVS